MKLTPMVNFINILCSHFLYESLFGSFFSSYVLTEKALSYEKNTLKMLMKLTLILCVVREGLAKISYVISGESFCLCTE